MVYSYVKNQNLVQLCLKIHLDFNLILADSENSLSCCMSWEET